MGVIEGCDLDGCTLDVDGVRDPKPNRRELCGGLYSEAGDGDMLSVEGFRDMESACLGFGKKRELVLVCASKGGAETFGMPEVPLKSGVADVIRESRERGVSMEAFGVIVEGMTVD